MMPPIDSNPYLGNINPLSGTPYRFLVPPPNNAPAYIFLPPNGTRTYQIHKTTLNSNDVTLQPTVITQLIKRTSNTWTCFIDQRGTPLKECIKGLNSECPKTALDLALFVEAAAFLSMHTDVRYRPSQQGYSICAQVYRSSTCDISTCQHPHSLAELYARLKVHKLYFSITLQKKKHQTIQIVRCTDRSTLLPGAPFYYQCLSWVNRQRTLSRVSVDTLQPGTIVAKTSATGPVFEVFIWPPP